MVDRKWMMLTNTSLAALMTQLDANTILIALPTIGRELPSTSALDVVWMVIGYQLVLGSVLVNLGRIADLFGRARLYKLGYLALTLGSALCSVAQTGDQLVLFRFIQGGGAALILANTTALIMDAFPAKERGMGIGINTISLSSGMILGLVLGGALTAFLGWRSIFWINVPIGVFSLVWSHYQLKETRKLPGKPTIDILGNITFLGALAMFLAGVTLYALALLDTSTFLALICGSLVSLALFVYVELHVKSPMLSLRLFKIRPFAVGNLIQFIQGIGRGATTLVMTFYLQGPTMQLSPLVASFFLVPTALASVIMSPVSGILSDRYGRRIFTLLGSAIGLVGSLLLAQLGPTTSFWQVSVPLVINGIGGSLFGTPNRTQVVGAVKADDRGVATGVYLTFANVGSTLSRGVTFLVMGLILPAAVLQAVFAGGNAGNPTTWENEFITSMHLVFYFGAALTGVSVILCLLWYVGIIKDNEEGEEFTTRAPASDRQTTAGSSGLPEGAASPAGPTRGATSPGGAPTSQSPDARDGVPEGRAATATGPEVERDSGHREE